MKDAKEAKKKFRLEIKNELKNISKISNSKEEYETKCLKISNNFFLFLNDLNANPENLTFGVFSPMKDENEAGLILENFSNFNLTFPKMDEDGTMIFCHSKLEELVPCKKFGKKIWVPGTSEIACPDLLLVPGLAFSKEGNRLGRGKGFYDRYISSNIKNNKNEEIKLLGICFESQLRDDFPVEEHDKKMNLIITENRILKI